MKTQQHLTRIWTTISQWLSQFILSSAARWSTLGIVMLACVCGLFLLSVFAFHLPELSALHSLGTSVLHQLNRIPFGEPWP